MKKILVLLMATIMIFGIVACDDTKPEYSDKTDKVETTSGIIEDTQSDVTEKADSVDTDETTTADEENTPSDITLNFEPTIDGDVLHGFGFDMYISNLNTNAEEIEHPENSWALKWFNIYGENDDIASIAIRAYSPDVTFVAHEWNGSNILRGLEIASSDDTTENNETLQSTNPADWKVDRLEALQNYVFETENAYWACVQLGERFYKPGEKIKVNLEINILPKDNRLLDSYSGNVRYQGIKVVINVGNAHSVLIGQPTTFIDEETYKVVSDLLKDTWGVELPEYTSFEFRLRQPK